MHAMGARHLGRKVSRMGDVLFLVRRLRLVKLPIMLQRPSFLLSIALGLALTLGGHGQAHARGASDATNARGPVVILGVDGMTFDVLRPMFAKGELPNLESMHAQGASAVLMSERPMRSPALWTTIATGQHRKHHRIYDFVTGSAFWPRRERHKEQRLVTSAMRAEPALWNMVSEARKSLVVGWLNTWPAEPIHGVMVAPYVALGQRRQTTIKGRIYGDVTGQTHPEHLASAVQSLVVSPESVSDELIQSLLDVPPPDSPLYQAIPKLERYLYTARWSIASTLTNLAVLEEQLEQNGPFDLVMSYFDGSDTLAHRFWLFREPLPTIQARLTAHGIDPALAPELKERFGHALEGYYRLVDGIVGKIQRAAGPNATMVILSDHGWGSLAKAGKAPYDHVPFDGEHRLEGVWLASGPTIRPGQYHALTLYDVVPTALTLLGLPVPTKLPGRVAWEQLNEKAALALAAPRGQATKPRETTPSNPASKPVEAPFAEQELERLRSLGYVQ